MRTDSDKVKSIIEVETGFDLTPFMEASNELVTEFCSDAGYTEDRLIKIETWLAAHFYCMYDPRATSESAGVSASYEGAVALGFNLSKYGQMAMTLDTAGGLARHNKAIVDGKKGITAGITWLGRKHHHRHIHS